MFVSVKVRVITDETGAYTELPGLLTPAGVLTPLLDYCLSRSHDRSLAWMDKVIRSMQMFLEYMHCNPLQRDTHLLFQNFALRLYSGTFDLATGLDPSGLAWSARSAEDAGHIITNLSYFFDWLGAERPAAARINPKYSGDSFDRICDETAYQYRRDKALLGHTWSDNLPAPEGGRRVRPQRTPQVTDSDPPAFPEDQFMDLLTNGFKVGRRHDYRGILITLLQHGGGFRESEPFHLYIEDVIPDPSNPNSALVRIHHPSQGAAPAHWKDVQGRPRKGNRAAYLHEKFGIAPRTQLQGTRKAGWKGGMHDGRFYKEVRWFQPEYGELFLRVWRKYLHQVAQTDRIHPFAFVNLSRGTVGERYTLGQYNKAHARACRRIGLKVCKELGTTPHGHRHAYGRRLRAAGVEKAFIKRFMHHGSLQSQETYTQATAKEMQLELQAAALRLERIKGSADGPLEMTQLLKLD
jgi:hypothetical protein